MKYIKCDMSWLETKISEYKIIKINSHSRDILLSNFELLSHSKMNPLIARR